MLCPSCPWFAGHLLSLSPPASRVCIGLDTITIAECISFSKKLFLGVWKQKEERHYYTATRVRQ